MTDEDEPGDLFTARAGLILALRGQGVTDRDLLNAFESVPHEAFVPDDYAGYAYKDSSLPIACGQSITSPVILAKLLQLLDPAGAGKVLEIGTGSGYAAMLLSRLARRVFTTERFRELSIAAEMRWQALGVTNIIGNHADGLEGLPQQAPFERILLTGSVTEIPEALIAHLTEDGVLVAPVGPPNERQTILRLVRSEDDVAVSEHGSVRLAPLVHGRARAL